MHADEKNFCMHAHFQSKILHANVVVNTICYIYLIPHTCNSHIANSYKSPQTSVAINITVGMSIKIAAMITIDPII